MFPIGKNVREDHCDTASLNKNRTATTVLGRSIVEKFDFAV